MACFDLECVDTAAWNNGGTYNCELYGRHVCHYVCDGVGCTGQALIGSEWALGSNHNYPEQNCCACGKIGAAQGKQFVK